ncbi:hypothetical protein JW935_25540 [candidate division KSB1 bacterium]|nr:hypothetical protein [candidate division KSB1 bacterium]
MKLKLRDFCRDTSLLAKSELEKVRLLAFFYQKTKGVTEFTIEDVFSWFESLDLPRPNSSRLLSKMRKSRVFVKGKKSNSFRIHAIELDELQATYPGVHTESEEVISEDTVLPRPVYENSRGFTESLAKQINASYEYNIHDGCAVLMRRLLEVLLILAYEHLGIEQEIQDNNNQYLPLEVIIKDAKQNKTLNLSRDSKAVLDDFRLLGNFSAHKIYYNCRRADLRPILATYRATVEELLYKSGIRK